ncbi:hypothetical protein ACFSTA_08255 [Ornithinibacillus salinisoli]|uniref:Uncharacterized protein n=1 Tax=Ornithinibacillus salinisoli TaxID=1848459 RepID=A0ABW4VZW8_9BACI
MKTNRKTQIIGWLLFLFAIGFFCIQMGFMYLQANYEAEYVDNRLFYIINMLFVICLALALWLLLALSNKWKWFGASISVVFILVNVVLLVTSSKDIRLVTSISPNFKQVFSIKENTDTGEAVFYRSYYGILARPKEKLPYQTDGTFQVKWLADDVAVATYKAADDTIHQYVGTYGDRSSGISYYYVGAEVHGLWKGEGVEVLSSQEGITVTQNNQTELFDWEHVVQFGTLAVVLTRENEAVWTIALNENFEVNSNTTSSQTGEISLYRATMGDMEPIILQYAGN